MNSECYSLIASQIGLIADGIMDDGVEIEFAHFAIKTIYAGITDESLLESLHETVCDLSLSGEKLAFKLYDIASDCFLKAKSTQ